VNKNGLSRSIPAATKLRIRQNSAFGCVRCRAALCDYEHIDPPFAEATEHDAAHICLLCPACHAQVTRGRVSKREVQAAYDKLRAEGGTAPPWDDSFFDAFDQRIELVIGDNTFKAVDTLIAINGQSFLKYWPTQGHPPFVLSGIFHDARGVELFRINENEWIGPVDVFDIEQKGPNLSIRGDRGQVLFAASKNANTGTVAIEVLDMVVAPFHILTLGDALHIGRLNSDLTFGLYTVLKSWHVLGGNYALYLDESDLGEGLGRLTFDDRGYRFEGTGISVAPGRASTALGGFSIVEHWSAEPFSAPGAYRRALEAHQSKGGE